jgi:hypothetical protein
MNNDIYLFGLAFGCPQYERKACCPFKKIENISFKEKVDWIKCQSEKNKISMYEYHAFCTLNYPKSDNILEEAKFLS